MFLSAEQIASATAAPLEHCQASWPAIGAALTEFGLTSLEAEIAAAATVAVETSIFMPIRELHADPNRQPELWQAQQHYWPSGFYGRGFIMLTWQENYQRYGELLGLDLVGNPDLLLEPTPAAHVLGRFFMDRGVEALAKAGDWQGVRSKVNGGTNGLSRFLDLINKLKSEAANA
jgi:hypothetical protein